MEAIVLAGGLGTRLKAITQTLPKPMAPIGSRPFLEFLLDYLLGQGCDRIILSVGYKAESISSYFQRQYRTCELIYSIESEPLGTGGALQQAMQQVQSPQVIVVNGDTLFQVPLPQMMQFHQEQTADLTLALKPMHHFDRYGNVVLEQTRVQKFEEKQYCAKGLINGGIYILNRDLFSGFVLPPKFSFETDFIQPYLSSLQVQGFVSEQYFIDIGIPDDFARAQLELVAL